MRLERFKQALAIAPSGTKGLRRTGGSPCVSQGATSWGPSHQGEVHRIYRAIFRRSAPTIIERRFLEASKLLEQKASHEELERYRRALEEVRDLEALEIACRYTRKLPLLCLKFRLAVHLAETLPENQRFFVNEEASVARALWALFAGAIGTALKLMKGLYLLTRLRHARRDHRRLGSGRRGRRLGAHRARHRAIDSGRGPSKG